eukprot:6488364-Amphidinium_carterae.1
MASGCKDWPGGAGNFFGTLYAWHKACTVLKETEAKRVKTRQCVQPLGHMLAVLVDSSFTNTFEWRDCGKKLRVAIYVRSSVGGSQWPSSTLPAKVDVRDVAASTRLAPLPGGENNNKPGVKLPVPGSVSILESVIRRVPKTRRQ